MGKQSLSIILTSLFTFSLVGCGGSDSDDTPDLDNGYVTMFTVNAISEGAGNVIPSMHVVEKGKTADFTLVVENCYQIDTVTGCGGVLNGNIYTTGDVIADCLITAVFRPAGHIVEVHISSGGSVEPEGLTVQHGDIAEFKTKPELAYQVADAYGCNGRLSGDTYKTGEIVSDCDIYITFQPIGGGVVLGRYIDNGDGTITDPDRKLMWMRCSIGQTWQNGACVGDARDMMNVEANVLSYHDGNYGDWRLPKVEELRSLVYCSSGYPAYWLGAEYKNGSGFEWCLGDYKSPVIVESIFPIPQTLKKTYVSTGLGTPTGLEPGYFYTVSFSDGRVNDRSYSNMSNYVRMVRVIR